MAVTVLSQPADRSASIIDDAAVGLGDPAAETLSGGLSARITSDWRYTMVDALSEAEAFLDYLEANGHTDRELVVIDDHNFAVRWR